MVYPNPFHNDGLSNYPMDTSTPPTPTPPTPLTTPATISSNFILRRKNHFTTPTTTMETSTPPTPTLQTSLTTPATISSNFLLRHKNHFTTPHHDNGSSFAGTCFPSLLSPDLTVNDLSIPYADLPEQEWLSEFLYCCSNDYFWETCETMALAGFSTAQSDASFTSKADQKDSRTASGKSRPKTEAYGGSSSGKGSGTRRCTHCAADDTPQWRGGPLGPKTLCNACEIRNKSGRLVPEYRLASSPTFELSQHSNSHRKVLELQRKKDRKVLELRRQKELMRKQQVIHE